MKQKIQWRKKVAFMVSLILLITMVPILTFGEANDIGGHWAGGVIAKWIEKGLAKGYPDGSFRPNNSITRAEFIALTNKVFGFTEEAIISFKDVKEENWFAPAIKQAIAAGYISGYPDGTIRPHNPISRQEVAIIIGKVKNLEERQHAANIFSDSQKISSWSKGFVGAVLEKGFIGGYPDGSFKPTTSITRAEALVVLNNVMIVGEETIEEFIGVFDKVGIYGDKTIIETLEGDIYIKSEDVTLQNMVIKGDLIIAEEVGEGEVYLNNITVEGDTYIRGGGIDSIYINDGSYRRIIIQKAGKGIRVVAIGGRISNLMVYPETEGNEVIFKGSYEEITVLADDIILITQEDTIIKKLTVGKETKNATVTTSKETIIDELIIDSPANFNNEGRIKKAIGTAVKGAIFDVNQPENFIISSGGGGGGSSTPVIIEVSAITATPPAGKVAIGTKVTLDTATEGATIYYTLDGSIPTTSSNQYSDPITINSTTTIKAIGVKSGMNNSSVETFSYTVEEPAKPEMTVSPAQVTVDSNFNQTFILSIANDTVTETVYSEHISLREVFSGLTLSNVVRKDNTTVTVAVYGNLKGAGTGTIILDADALVNSESKLTVNVTVVEGTVVPVNAITVTGAGDATTITTDAGTLQMSAAVSPNNATNKNVIWSVTLGTGVATINSNGLLTAIENGTVTVVSTAQDGSGATGELKITISNQTDKNVLATEITVADVNKGTVSVSVDGSDILITEQWVTATNMSAYETAIGTAQGVYNDNDATQAEVDAAVTALQAATVTFNGAKTAGTLKATPVVKTAVTATAVNAGGTLENSTLAGAFKDPNTDANVLGCLSWNNTATVVNETGNFEWTFTPTNTADYNTVTGSVEVVAIADKSVLATEITVANVNKGTVSVSVDGSDILITEQWVTATNMSAYETAIGTAQGVYNDNDATQAEVDAAVTALQAATVTFNGAKTAGTLKATPVVKTAVTATAVNAGGTLENSTLAGAFKDPNTDANVLGSLSWNNTATVVNETGNFEWTFTPTNTADYNTVTGSVEVVAIADKSVLATEITVANVNKGTVSVSVDGSDILITEQWVTATNMSAYETAIGTAQGVYNDNDATQAEVDVAVTTLAAATSTFNSAKAAGTLTIAPQGLLLDAEAGTDFTGVLYTRDGNIYYNQQDSEGIWGSEALIGVGGEGRLAIDGSAKPHVAYVTKAPSGYDAIGYRKFDGTGWTVEELIESNGSANCSKPDIAVDSQGFSHITYTDRRGNSANYDDIMYATNVSGSFVKTLIGEGYYGSFFSGSWDWNYFTKGSYITIDNNDQYYIMTHERQGNRNSWGDTYNNYRIWVNSNNISGNNSSDDREIYSILTNNGKLYALYRAGTVKVTELTVSDGSITSANDRVVTDITTAFSHDVSGNNIVIGSKDGNNLRVHYNENPTTYNQIEVAGNAVSIVNLGGIFYAFYTDNEDDSIKRLEITE
ncbi:S-layer homology domain-containing protein [Natronincola ferrireducens]|uniref:Ig-like domain (Group 2) n=1 Tax=Natronincola ferrireducens TaxID=393762 RepID=A0A1G8ZA24_9FIRM|nr:S-layer homology domain-containing protein [Natronincola ferrireducens]SDK11901.1 Ig-like domain (group 2) [Natronincola ferrireducens]